MGNLDELIIESV